MKSTLLPQLFTWSAYQADRRIDFNGFFWSRPAGGLLIDPMPLAAEQLEFLSERGGAAAILLTNADHLRAAPELKERLGARVLAPEPDRERFGEHAALVDEWFGGTLPGALGEAASVATVRGGKGPGEAVLYLREERALLFGDVVRSHVSGRIHLLPDEKLADRAAVADSLRELQELPVEAVLLGDGDSLFRGAGEAWRELLASLDG